MAASASDYRTKLAQEQQRYGRGPITGRGGTESARDAAVRATNIAMGLGNSTALKYPQNAPPPPPAKTARARGGGDVTSSTASPYSLNRSNPKANPDKLADPSVMTSPSAAGGFYTGADPGLTQSPTSVPTPALGPTTQPQAALGPTTQPGSPPNVMQTPTSVPGFLSPLNRAIAPFMGAGGPGQPGAGVGLGMQPRYPYAMPSPSNVPPHGSLLIPNYGAGVGMPTPPVGGIGGINLFGTGGYGA